MKKIILFLIMSLMLYPVLHAQTKIGLLAGMNFSNIRQEMLFPEKTNISGGLAIGGIIEFGLNDYLSLAAEPQYIQKGTHSDPIEVENRSAEVSINMEYLEIPLYLKYAVGDRLKPYMFAGPVVGINMNSSVGAAFSGLEIAADMDEITNTFEFGLHVGGGMNYQIDEYVTIFLEAKYAFGLNDVIKKGEFNSSIAGESLSGSIPNESKYFNRGFQVMFGFSFPLSFK